MAPQKIFKGSFVSEAAMTVQDYDYCGNEYCAKLMDKLLQGTMKHKNSAIPLKDVEEDKKKKLRE